jgi:hypothetical protein
MDFLREFLASPSANAALVVAGSAGVKPEGHPGVGRGNFAGAGRSDAGDGETEEEEDDEEQCWRHEDGHEDPVIPLPPPRGHGYVPQPPQGPGPYGGRYGLPTAGGVNVSVNPAQAHGHTHAHPSSSAALPCQRCRQLQDALDESEEELEKWRSRCEALSSEVRALQRLVTDLRRTSHRQAMYLPYPPHAHPHAHPLPHSAPSVGAGVGVDLGLGMGPWCAPQGQVATNTDNLGAGVGVGVGVGDFGEFGGPSASESISRPPKKMRSRSPPHLDLPMGAGGPGGPPSLPLNLPPTGGYSGHNGQGTGPLPSPTNLLGAAAVPLSPSPGAFALGLVDMRWITP